MKRRSFLVGSLAAGLAAQPALAQSVKYGLVLLHGKLDHVDGYLAPLAALAKQRGHESETPNLPWSRGRYLAANWDSAITQVSQAVNSLRIRDVRRVILVGHGIGCVLAMNYIAFRHSNRQGLIHGLVAIAPGHVPEDYYNSEPAVRESVNRARAMVAAGNGLSEGRFFDSDDGRPLAASLAAVNYLSYLDPEGQATYSKTFGKITLPLLWVSNGQQDSYPTLRETYDSLNILARNNPRYPGVASSDLPAQAAPAIARWLDGF